MQINRPRGTKDLFKKELNQYNFVIDTCKNLAKNYGFEEIIIPTFEHSELFKRNNENSDIVKKELYEFKDRGNRSIALRPEGTASLIRCLGENKLLKTEPLPLKIFMYGSMFRYERPQDKRQREFQQFDVEIVGTNSKYDVVDVISYGNEIIKKLNLANQTELKINFIGSFATRTKWIKALQNYFKDYVHELTELSKERIDTNPLRILDDKIDSKLPCVINAPKINNFLSSQEKASFEETLKLLDLLNINYKVTDNLVRGLDYYTDIVFEFVDIKNDITIIGGGQYDKLVEELTGIDLKAIGLAVGVNRCANMLNDQILEQISMNLSNKIVLIGLDNVPENEILKYSQILKNNGCPLIYFSKIKDIKKAIKLAERINYRFLGIIGLKENQNKEIQIKDLFNKKQELLKQDNLLKWWTDKLNNENSKSNSN
ncbi:histidine--tRNA ligase [Mycoplasmoides pirum]|uniref:histidine--tRNA ligase n=1 Tax=Mycoplasmoides pirum TaxID=2122 RepID=UPI00048479ED|nr:histidine--tRNA ligase [Mycoplasmoides pirum]